MLLQLLNRKEKLKFLDAALHMINADGQMSTNEMRLLDIYVSEVGDNIRDEYQFKLSQSIEETIKFFEDTSMDVKNIIYLNLLILTMRDEFYNTDQHFFLVDIQKAFNITNKKKLELMRLVYEERDLREKAKRVISS